MVVPTRSRLKERIMAERPLRILSGIQPTGSPHLGNYFGMMKPAIELQEQGEAFYFIADFHALTSIQDRTLLRDNSKRMALDFLACGLDPEKAVFFRQSDVPEVTELAWILSTLAPLGLLERCHSYKDKVAKGMTPNTGLFTYPLLMAADILIYDSHVVPVGKDQKQHVEVTRDLAQRFNRIFGETLVIPEPLIREDTAVVPGLDGQKMSKSYDNTIMLFESPAQQRKKVMRIVTDSTPVEGAKDPDKCNVFALYKLFAEPVEIEELAARYRAGGMGYGEAKKLLNEKLQRYFEPMRARREELAANPKQIEDILEEGGRRARLIARRTLDRVRSQIGLA